MINSILEVLIIMKEMLVKLFKTLPFFTIGYFIGLLFEIIVVKKDIFIFNQCISLIYFITFGLYYLLYLYFKNTLLAILFSPIIYGLIFHLIHFTCWKRMNPEKKNKIITKRQARQQQKMYNNMSFSDQVAYIQMQQIRKERQQTQELQQQLIRQSTEHQKKMRIMQEEAFNRLLEANTNNPANNKNNSYNGYEKDVDIMFSGVTNQENLKKRYLALLKIYHPDNQCGDTDITKKIKDTYEKYKKQM